ncbi:efflux RND transporter periplasmic adaptor subunit [Planosporangium flavigriseum]|uniref:efflux RND transporter periplasmic adaptor subunit n=1 Tax=Planosporangium flavigriseum TaxID=373681 RepID=UPI001438CF66|nr:efflux RND transporter periplasmic adaptor subunit [Planosporangium flavigriseum]NJC67099.1 efflux RND transporter periplasmic adaptor subunit [Planosporangium flavigriseum]
MPDLRRLRRPTLVVNAVLVALLLVGVMLSYRAVSAGYSAAANSGTAGIGLVTSGQVITTVSTIGTVQSAAMANLSFGAPGTVTEINVKTGDAVKKDQVLAKINSAKAQEQLSDAQASLSSAQQSLNRVRSTTDANTVALAQSQVTSAQNSLNAAQRAVSGTTLTAPIDGTVIAVNGTVGTWWSGATADGQTASASSISTPFIQIADLSQLQVSTSFAEVDAMKIKADRPAMVTWPAMAGAQAAGRVTAIAPAASSQNSVNSYPATISLGALPDGVRIGQTVNVTVTTAEVNDAVRVPVAAVRSQGERHTTEVVRPDGTRETRALDIGLKGDQFVEIRSGLTPGERVTLHRDESRGSR